MLHAAAKLIVREHGGKFPRTAAALRELPGIGRYTAAAIASMAFGEPVAVVDGNVERVLQRTLGNRLVGEAMWEAAGSLLDHERAGDFNQAMMELGATVCTPRAPACLTCPVVEMCATRRELVGSTKATRQKKCEIYYVLDCRDGRVFLVRRPREASLMPGMWELPEVENGNGTSPTSFTLRHSITVTDYTVRVTRAQARGAKNGRWVSKSRVTNLALTGLARKILRASGVI
jgi:A/G-specific adenine glycosylase